MQINPGQPAAYTWQVPGTDVRYQAVFGGTPQAASALAQEQVTNTPNSIVFFTDVRYNELGQAQEYVRAWNSNAEGRVELVDDVVNPITGQGRLPTVQPNDLVGRVQ